MRIFNQFFGASDSEPKTAPSLNRESLNDLFHAEFRAHSYVCRRDKTKRQALHLRAVKDVSGAEYIKKACRNRATAVTKLSARRAEYVDTPSRTSAALAVAGGAAHV